MSRALRRVGTAQAGFPRDRGRWLAAAIALAMVLGGFAVMRGPYGGALGSFGAGVRVFALVLIALLPVVALAWAWRRVHPWVRRVAPLVVGVLAAVLLLLAAAHADVYAERAGMRRPPAAEAAEAFRRSDVRFWAVEDGEQGVVAPPVANRCIVNRYGVRVIPGAVGPAAGEAHRAYLAASLERARRFNEAMLQRLEIPLEEARRVSEGFCPQGR